MNLPADIANQALDAVGADIVVGDIQEGTREAQILLRAYSQCLRQLLRAAHWNFARKQAPLSLLADASANTPNVGTLTVGGFAYEYQYPIDCMKARFVPWQPSSAQVSAPAGNIQPPNPSLPLMPGLNNDNALASRMRPARFLEAMDVNYPPPAGTLTWEVQGVSPQGRTVICTNVKDAQIVYTALMNYPSNWDAQFRAAFVAYLAAEIALPVWTKRDRKFGLQVRDEQIKIAAGKITQARITDGNEGWFSSDISVDWIRTRFSGAGRGGGGWGDSGGPGILFSGLDGCCGVGETSAY